ncbi:MAG: RNA polymerase sigma factor [Paracoccaceae bacterium]
MLSATSEGIGDAALLDGVAGGDAAAFRTLFERYYPAVHGFAARITGTPETADEVANDTMMAIWTGAERFRGGSKVSTWIFGIAYRTAHKALRRKGVERGRVAVDEAYDLADETALPGETAVYHREVAGALAALPTELRTMMQLTYYYGYSVAEVAEVSGCPPGTVKSRMHEARRRLKEVLA